MPSPKQAEVAWVDAGVDTLPKVKVLTVTGTVVDASMKALANAYVCDVFEADLMLGIDSVPRVIGLRTPKVDAKGWATSCAKTNAQGVFVLSAPTSVSSDGGMAPSDTEGFQEGKEFSVWAGPGLSRVPAKSDRMALGIPSHGALIRLSKPTAESMDVGPVVLKEVKPFAVSYRVQPKTLKKAKLFFSKGPSSAFMSVDFAQAEPSWPKNGLLPVKPQGTVEVPLPLDLSYVVHWNVELSGQEAPKTFEQAVTHPASQPVEFVIESTP